MCNLLDVHKTRTTPFRPLSDGFVEHFNRTLEAMLSLYVDENQNDWDKYVSLIIMTYRATPHESPGLTPYMLTFEREISLPIELMVAYLPGLMQRFPVTMRMLKLCKSGSCQCLNQLEPNCELVPRGKRNSMKIRRPESHFFKNDLVWFHTPHRKVGLSSKLQKYWQGPYKIIN